MKKIAITILMACALLGAGCSGPDETVAAPTATPRVKTAAELQQEATARAEMKPRKDAKVQEETGSVPSSSPTP